MASRQFTLEEANVLLTRLSELLPQLQDKKRALDTLQQRLAEFAAKMSGNGNIYEEQYNTTRHEAEQAANEVTDLARKVNELGCELKDVDQGLVDFPTVRQGRRVYLCWKLGEDRIRWWHDLEAGFAGREPLGEDEQ
ncbi:MAG: DUF2203 domain-containing protein [Chloroflexi bacterium]|nr:DUF2203 domain-containing protein [Chloroflexota bacterium]